MICLNCGKEIPDGSKFCPYCGVPIKQNVAESASKTKRYKKLIIGLTVAFLFIASLSGCAPPKSTPSSNKPIWPMFRYNAEHTGRCPYDTSKNNGKLKWKYKTGRKIYSSPAIGADGTVYVGSEDDYLYAIGSK